MATVTHYIYSHYDEKKDRRALELATGQTPSERHDETSPEDDVDLMSDVLLPLSIVRGDGNPPWPIPGGLLL